MLYHSHIIVFTTSASQLHYRCRSYFVANAYHCGGLCQYRGILLDHRLFPRRWIGRCGRRNRWWMDTETDPDNYDRYAIRYLRLRHLDTVHCHQTCTPGFLGTVPVLVGNESRGRTSTASIALYCALHSSVPDSYPRLCG